MSVDVILGLQWGDEGKGKIVDLLAPKYDIVARFQGGPNAGHTIIFDNNKLVLHTIPSGISSKKTINIIGNGVLIDPYIFEKEINLLKNFNINPKTNLLISNRSHIITPTHRFLDAALEKSRGNNKIGSTLKGIGPTYTDKVARKGLRVGDLKSSNFNQKLLDIENNHLNTIKALGFETSDFQIENMSLEEYKSKWINSLTTINEFEFADTEIFLNNAIYEGKKILAEGAQGTLLDLDFGTYPFVTSSNTTTGGVCTGLGIAPSSINKVFGVFKAYCTRVGSGPFPTELFDNIGEEIRKAGHEFGSTTGRPRRCGWIDLPALRYSIMINGVTDLIITKADVLNIVDNIQVCDKYIINNTLHNYPPYEFEENQIILNLKQFKSWKQNLFDYSKKVDLPIEFLNYIDYLETELKKPISIISTGPDRVQTIINY